jgi:predicted phage tail component-like protein
MSLPTFNGFSLQDTNFITERVVFKGYGDRGVIRAKANRREGIKLLASEFGEKEVTLEGVLVAASVADLQSKLDDMKKALTAEEGDLVIETDRTFHATVTDLAIPDEHYNQSKTDWSVTFVCSQPFAEASQLMAVTPVTSGVFTFSGSVNISGTLFSRPVIIYTPPTGPGTGNTRISTMSIYHVQTGQTATVSGFGSSAGLDYSNVVTINMDTFTALEGSSDIGTSGSFPRWEPGINTYTVTVSGRFPGGTITVQYQPRYV